jgi:hypothetical protein
VWIAAPVDSSFMFDAGTTIVFGLYAASGSPLPVVMLMLSTACENTGSDTRVWTASCAALILIVIAESAGCPLAMSIEAAINALIKHIYLFVILLWHLCAETMCENSKFH